MMSTQAIDTSTEAVSRRILTLRGTHDGLWFDAELMEALAAERDALKATQDKLAQALVKAIIPLEAMKLSGVLRTLPKECAAECESSIEAARAAIADALGSPAP